MPWHKKSMKDVTGCEKLRGAANKRYYPKMSEWGNPLVRSTRNIETKNNRNAKHFLIRNTKDHYERFLLLRFLNVLNLNQFSALELRFSFASYKDPAVNS